MKLTQLERATLRKIQSAGGKKRAKGFPSMSEIGKKGAKSRWAKWRKQNDANKNTRNTPVA